MATIRKAFVREFGDASKVLVIDAELLDPAPGEVQVRVEFSGFSGADINMRRGTYPFQKKPPLTPGYCLVGSVAANGVGCGRFTIGQRVACLSIYGAEAERVNLPEKYLVAVPPELNPVQATALILDWNTAYGMVMHAARVKPGQKVFVHGMSGAVGRALVSLAKRQEAEVFGTASPKNHAALKELGATPFGYADKAWARAMRTAGGVDAVFDALGFESFDESYSILRRGGVLVAYGLNLPALTGGAPRPVLPAVLKLLGRNLAFWTRRRTVFYYISRTSKHFSADLLALFDLVKSGEVVVPIKAIYPLERIQDAHREWGKSAGVGSVIINVGGFEAPAPTAGL